MRRIDLDHDGPRLVDARGLTGNAAVLLAVAVAFLGLALNLLTSGALGRVFDVFFVGGCLAAALLARRRSLLTIVVMPPLVFTAAAAATGLTVSGDTTGSLLMRVGLEALSDLVTSAPVLVFTTLAVAAIAALRWVAPTRRTRPPGRPSAAPPRAGAFSG